MKNITVVQINYSYISCFSAHNITVNFKKMAKNTLVPQAKAALDKFKMEAAAEVGVNLSNGYNGDITARQAGSVGGQMVKKMIESYENGLK